MTSTRLRDVSYRLILDEVIPFSAVWSAKNDKPSRGAATNEGGHEVAGLCDHGTRNGDDGLQAALFEATQRTDAGASMDMPLPQGRPMACGLPMHEVSAGSAQVQKARRWGGRIASLFGCGGALPEILAFAPSRLARSETPCSIRRFLLNTSSTRVMRIVTKGGKLPDRGATLHAQKPLDTAVLHLPRARR